MKWQDCFFDALLVSGRNPNGALDNLVGFQELWPQGERTCLLFTSCKYSKEYHVIDTSNESYYPTLAIYKNYMGS